MNTILYKTNINCGGCVTKVAPVLDALRGIIEWNVDTASSNKVLTVCSSGDESLDIEAKLTEIGFNVTQLN